MGWLVWLQRWLSRCYAQWLPGCTMGDWLPEGCMWNREEMNGREWSSMVIGSYEYQWTISNTSRSKYLPFAGFISRTAWIRWEHLVRSPHPGSQKSIDCISISELSCLWLSRLSNVDFAKKDWCWWWWWWWWWRWRFCQIQYHEAVRLIDLNCLFGNNFRRGNLCAGHVWSLRLGSILSGTRRYEHTVVRSNRHCQN